MKQNRQIVAQAYENIFAAPPEIEHPSPDNPLREIFGNSPAQVVTGNAGPRNHMTFDGRSEATHGGFDFGKLWHIGR